MNFQKVKTLYNSEWINKMCDDITSINPSDFILKNKKRIYETLLTALGNSVDMSIPNNKEYKEAYSFVVKEYKAFLSLTVYMEK